MAENSDYQIGVLNPVHVARLILEETTQPLTLKRVPPNLLVGAGAMEYAYHHNVPILPHDALISVGAKDRWNKWAKDMQAARDEGESIPVNNKEISALRNEGQPSSPFVNEKPAFEPPPGLPQRPFRNSPLSNSQGASYSTSAIPPDPAAFTYSSSPGTGDSSGASINTEPGLIMDGVHGVTQDASNDHNRPEQFGGDITDTVGAIAVDCFGRIAAASSSGGIGMKYKGRIGPAALAGVGTAVIPAHPRDEEQLSVAAVTSGTGEHMATTMAANTCANRLYYNQKMTRNGTLEESSEDETMQNFIRLDFMSQ